MTDEVAAPGPTDPAPGLMPVVAEIVAPAAPVVAEVVAPAEPAAPAVAETPAVVAEAAAAEPEAEVKPAEAPKAPERPKTLLEKADEERAAKEAAAKAKKPDETEKKAGEEAKPADAEKPAEAEAEAPLTFELPKQLKAEPEQIEEFSNLLRSTKTGDLKESGQKLLDLHAKALDAFAKQYAQETSDNQWKVWNELIAAKDKEVLADPDIGGSGHETAMAAIVRMRDLAVPEKDRAAFTDFLNVTGAGSWPPFLRMLHRFAEIFDEPPMPAPGGKPPKDAHIQQPTGKFALLHDHPSSQVKRD